MLQPLPNKPEAAGEAGSAATLSGRRNQRLQALGAERARFLALIGNVGSGERTSTGLSREEAREALDLMLQGQISDAQMGAFLIAHRIRRPQPLEIAGMLDSYRNQGPVLATSGRRALCFGVPYDGDPMPVKFGVTLAELFTALGIHWQGRSLTELLQGLDRHGLALTH